MSEFDKIVAALPKLSGAELQSIRERIGALIAIGGGKGNGGAKEESDEQWVLATLCDVLGDLGAERAHPGMLKRSGDIAAFRQKLPMVLKYLDKGGTSRLQRKALLAVGINTLYTNLTDMGVPVTTITMLRHFHRIPAVLNSAFPGYSESGHLDKIIRAHMMKRI